MYVSRGRGAPQPVKPWRAGRPFGIDARLEFSIPLQRFSIGSGDGIRITAPASAVYEKEASILGTIGTTIRTGVLACEKNLVPSRAHRPSMDDEARLMRCSGHVVKRCTRRHESDSTSRDGSAKFVEKDREAGKTVQFRGMFIRQCTLCLAFAFKHRRHLAGCPVELSR